MRQQKIILFLVILTLALTMFLTANIGYASVTNYSIDEGISTYDRGEFRVKFQGKPTVSGTGTAQVRIVGDTTATMNVSGLKKAGDYVTVNIGIKNTSSNISARLSKIVQNSNTEYFNVTATLSKNEINAKEGKSNVCIKIELIKTPIEKEQRASISVRVIAEPID